LLLFVVMLLLPVCCFCVRDGAVKPPVRYIVYGAICCNMLYITMFMGQGRDVSVFLLLKQEALRVSGWVREEGVRAQRQYTTTPTA
jgi:hypothetical protein